LRAVNEGLSHTPLPFASETPNLREFSDLRQAGSVAGRALCKTVDVLDHLQAFKDSLVDRAVVRTGPDGDHPWGFGGEDLRHRALFEA